MNTVSFVIGSWGSYNECNERALGSKWLNFDYFDDWDEIVEELKSEGFELDGIDEELFVQDIEGIPTDSKDWKIRIRKYCSVSALIFFRISALKTVFYFLPVRQSFCIKCLC